jgi:HSP20 family protein
VKPEDVNIQIAQEMVTISGTFEEQTEATENGFIHKELSRGSFRRSVTPPVPFKADEAKATFKDGLLTLTLPKAERALPTHVKVEVV